MIPIYKLEEDIIKGSFIPEGDPIPEGWTTNYDSLVEEVPEDPTLTQEMKALKEEVTNTQLALAEVFEIISGGDR